MSQILKVGFIALMTLVFWGGGLLAFSGSPLADSPAFAQSNGRDGDQRSSFRNNNGRGGNGRWDRDDRRGRGDRRERRRRWCRRNPDRCRPPTVSELPVHYMVASGLGVALMISGGHAYRLRRRNGKGTPTA